MILRHAVLIAGLCFPTALLAQEGGEAPGPWGFRARVVLSGSSHDSAPPGYKIYSGLGLDVGVVRRLSEVTSVELAFRTESREVNGPRGGGEHRLGSLELAPLTLLAQWRPRGWGRDGFQPFLGAGVNLTVTWEKSGVLDSTALSPSFGPAFQVGTDYIITPRASLNLDVKWNTLTLDIEDFGVTIPSVKIDPLTLGLGLGLRF